MNREEARQAINSQPLTNFIHLEKSRSGMYCCPVCGSGTGPRKSGALKLYGDNRVCCYSSGCQLGDKGQDTLGALRIIWNCGEAEVFERAGIDMGAAPRPVEPVTRSEKTRTDYSDFYTEAHQALKSSPEALAYLHARGITDETIDHFNLGYQPSWSHPSTSGRYRTKRIIIPRSRWTYTARAIDETEPDYSDAYKKQVAGSQKDIFNLEATAGAPVVVVVEGELDAASVQQATGTVAVGLGSVSNVPSFVDKARRTAPEAVYIVALDNDKPKADGKNPGQDAQEHLLQILTECGLACIGVDGAELYGECKDANELLVHDPARLQRVLMGYVAQAEGLKASRDNDRLWERAKRTGTGMMLDFMHKVQSRDYEPMPTGIRDIDRALSGGLIRKTLVLLGAAPGTGKTCLSQQMFETLAASGQNVLFINLEMSRDQLLARSLSRVCHHNGHDIAPLEILRGYAWTEAQTDAISTAAIEYVETVGENFVYNPDGTTAELDSILAVMEDEATRLEAEGKRAPLCVIDYLQLVQGAEREDDVSTMKRAIKSLKDYAINHDTVVFAIHATNREANKSGQVNQWSGRDTSAIEYSGDLMLALTYTAIEENETIEDEEGDKLLVNLGVIERLRKEAYQKGQQVPDICNRMTLKVLKNRFGENSRSAELYFDGEHATFIQIDRNHDAW